MTLLSSVVIISMNNKSSEPVGSSSKLQPTRIDQRNRDALTSHHKIARLSRICSGNALLKGYILVIMIFLKLTVSEFYITEVGSSFQMLVLARQIKVS